MERIRSSIRTSNLLLTLVILLLTFSSCPVRAQGENSDLAQMMAEHTSPVYGVLLRNLMSFNLTPAWRQYFLNPDSRANQTIGDLIDGLLYCGKHLGADDIKDIDPSNNGTNPLVLQAISRLAGLVHCTINMAEDIQDPKGEYKPLILETIGNFKQPMSDKEFCYPRGRKLNLFITVDTRAKALSCQVSKDGDDYHFVVPAYVDTRMEHPTPMDFFKQGR